MISGSKKLIFTVSILLSTIIAYSFFYGINQTKPKKKQKVKEVKMLASNNYDKDWKRVDSLEKKGLTQSALDLIEKIYAKAKKEKNDAQFIKSILMRKKFESYKEEFSLEKSIYKIQSEANQASYPSKQVLQNILASVYWNYYQQNRWKFLNRTQTIDFKNDDVSTWDLNKIVQATIDNYMASIASADSLKKTNLDVYDAIIFKGSKETRTLRPSLYDLLAHRAFDFFANNEAELSRPANQFHLNEDVFLNDYKKFNEYKINRTEDSLNLKFYAINLIQSLSKFHQNDENKDALIDVDLKRIEFVYRNSNNELKDTLYIRALNKITSTFPKSSLSAEAFYKIAEYYQSKASLYQPLKGDDYKWMSKKAMAIAIETIRNYPNTIGASSCESLIDQIKTKNINITLEDVAEPNKPARALVSYKNMDKLYFRIYKTTYQHYQEMSNYDYNKKFISKILALKLEKSFEYNLPNDGDFQQHAVEIKVPEMSNGFYVLVSSNDVNFSTEKSYLSYTTYAVSNIAYKHCKIKYSEHEFYLVHRQTGEPLKGVNAQMYTSNYDYDSRSYKRKKSKLYTTDEKGKFKVTHEEVDNKNFSFEFTYGNDFLDSENSFYLYKDYENNQSRMHSFIFMDRAIYRPGQTLYFKTILLTSDSKGNHNIEPNKAITVTLYDVNYQKVSDLSLTTNEFGTAAGTFILPQGLLNGQMHISDGYNTTYFSVEEYKRPKFEVKFNDLVGTYKVGEEIKLEGKALAYAGNSIDGAKVAYRVVRDVQYPYWWYWYRGYGAGNATSVEIVNGSVLTNDTGGYVIPFKAIPDPNTKISDSPIYTYSIYADITDINGETHSSQTSVRVGYQLINVNIDLPEEIDRTSKKEVSLSVNNLNGVKEPSKGVIRVYKLKQPTKYFRNRQWQQADKYIFSQEEYYSLFPTDLYADENNKYKWTKEKEVINTNFDTKLHETFPLESFAKLDPGAYVAEVFCKDKNGEEVKDIKYFTLYDENSPASSNEIDWFIRGKANCEPGEKASFVMNSAIKDLKFLLEIERNGKIVSSEWINAGMKSNTIDVLESDRGNFAYHVSFVRNNRFYYHKEIVTVPFTNKMLDISFETFRNKLLPGQEEEWKMIIKNKKGEKEIAELLATMYDASLDAFRSNNWYFNVYNSVYSNINWQSNLGGSNSSYEINSEAYKYHYPRYRTYDALNLFGADYSYYRSYNGYYDADYAVSESVPMAATPVMAGTFSLDKDEERAELKNKEESRKKSGKMDHKDVKLLEASNEESTIGGNVTTKSDEGGAKGISGGENLQNVKARSNFSETAFFFPQLQTNEKGEIIVKFKVPESLTKWKVMGLAHTKDLKFGQVSNELVTQKDLMVTPNAPRFFREGDMFYFSSKIANLSDKDLHGKVSLFLYDALTNQDISTKCISAVAGKFSSIGERDFDVKKGLSTSMDWEVKVPEGYGAITYKVVASAGNFTDGEEMAVPVLTNRMLVTESMPMPIRSNQTKEFNFTKFINQNGNSTTLKNHSYTLEFTANPAWYAVQSLPYLMEYPYECAEQTFSRYYANSLASHIVNSKPKVKQIFDSWKMSSPDAFLSNLQKNQELKAAVLEETPWVLDAKGESERKHRVALLFDLNRMSNELNAAMRKLQKQQVSNGAWPWFEGGPDDRYITQHIVTGLGHLDKLGVKNVREDSKTWNMTYNAVKYLDNRLKEDYEEIKRWDKDYKKNNHLGYYSIQYLYARSYFLDIPVDNHNKVAVDYFKEQAQKYWLSNARYMQGMIALSLNRMGDKKTPTDILKSLKENALFSEEMGMYWKDNYEGYYWYEAPIESHALLIEAFDEIANDAKTVDELKVWLVKSKQTQNWSTTKATTEAVYAMLLRGTDWLATEPNIEISLGDIKIDPKKDASLKAEAGTGYFKKVWNGSDIKPSMGNVKVVKKDEGVSYGAVYWQYFEQLDKITPHKTPLQLVKKLFVTRNTNAGPVIEPITDKTILKVGDKIKVRIELRVDRDMQYVHMKDMRAAGFEPTNVFSGYRYQDGLGYYECTKDASTNFFFSYLNKGSYVFEYPVVVNQAGNFSNGITTIQCMYAPEFTSHSEGIRVKITK